MKVRQWCAILLCAILAATAAEPAVVQAAGTDSFVAYAEGAYLASGVYGEEITWTLDRAGTFSMAGTGAMPDAALGAADEVPWHEYRGQIKRVEIGEGITHIGRMAFYECRVLQEVVLPDSIKSIGDVTFAFCTELKKVTFGSQLAEIGDLAFMQCGALTELSMPQTISRIGNQAFYGCESLKDIWFAGSCPSFQDEEVFKQTTLTIHVPYEFLGEWEPLKDSWAGADNISWANYCLSHAWKPGPTADKEASCTTAGLRSFQCTICDEVKTEEIPALGHKNVRNVTKATVSAEGSIVEQCTICGNVASTSVIACPKNLTLERDSYTYAKKAFTPAVTVTDSNGNVIAPEHYTVSYSKNKAVGTALAQVTFQGNYGGTLTKEFVIYPKGTSLSGLKGKKGGIDAKWKKQASQTDGYQVQCAANKKFKGAKNLRIKKPKTKSKTISKLKKKTKYYVRIRTYKVVNGRTYYSGWSKDRKSVV